jgi:hypothetical protein
VDRHGKNDVIDGKMDGMLEFAGSGRRGERVVHDWIV